MHGCFWHGHTCRHGVRVPKSNIAYWVAKIAGNRKRDIKARRLLRAAGWQVLTIWDCEIRLPTLAKRIQRFLSG